jgi:hypothetical protein
VSATTTTPPNGVRGSLAATVSRFGRRYRGALLIVAFCGWALLIRGVHLRLESGPRSTKGAGELLDIGALPVT